MQSTTIAIGLAKQMPDFQRIQTIPGVGLLTAAAIGISKRGDAYLRALLVQGASTVMISAKKAKHPDHLKQWALATEKRIHRNKAACAVANKMARIVWAVWCSESNYAPTPGQPAQRAA